ncbi:MAG: hypothetical protein AAGA68_22750 [Pseudomonadota bacterium]
MSELSDGISDSAEIFVEPVVDSAGSVWAVLFVGNGYAIVRGDPASGTWSTQFEYEGGSALILDTKIVIDQQDNITVAFRALDDTNELRALRYSPGGTWEEELVYKAISPDFFFQDINAAADADGNVVVVSMLETSVNRMFAVVYDADNDTWANPEWISPAANRIKVPTVVSSREGNSIEALYLVEGGGSSGMYARTFLSPSEGWTSPTLVRGTQHAVIPVGGGASDYPVVLDGSGNATVAYYLPIELGATTVWLFRATRRVDGIWGKPVTLRVSVGELAYGFIADFGDSDYDEDGNVAIVFKHQGNAVDPLAVDLWAFQFDAASDTWSTTSIYSNPLDGSQRSRVAFAGTNRALATYLDAERFGAASRFYDGEQWLDSIGLPGNPLMASHETAATRGDVAMLYQILEEQQEVEANWFRTTTR